MKHSNLTILTVFLIAFGLISNQNSSVVTVRANEDAGSQETTEPETSSETKVTDDEENEEKSSK
jgi:hypothetical protein